MVQTFLYKSRSCKGYLHSRGKASAQHKSPANLSHYRYIYVGKVLKQKDKKAVISLDNGKIVKNDDVIIMGPKTDTYLHFKANKLFYNGKLVKETPRGTKKNNVLIEMEVNGRVLGAGLDFGYIFTNKTYGKKYIEKVYRIEFHIVKAIPQIPVNVPPAK